MREFFWKYDSYIKAGFLLVVLLLAANLVFLNKKVLPEKQTVVPKTQVVEKILQPAPQPATAVCDEECQRIIAEEVARAVATISATASPSPPPAPVAQAQPQPKPSTPTTSYISLGSGGSTKKTDWVRLAGSEIQFDLSQYANSAKVYWEGNLKVFSANSRCYARLYDKSNLRMVDFSEQSTDKLDFEYLRSNQLTIWSGNNKYQLEAKSLNGIECSVDSPRLVIKY